MARCKLCKKDIADGIEYCTDCIDKKDSKANESYLDSLLDSVQGGAATAKDIYMKKKENNNSDSPDFDTIKQKNNSSAALMDIDDLNDFEDFDITLDLDDPIVISHDEIYGDDNNINSKNHPEIEHNIDNEFLESNDQVEEDDDLNEGFESNLADILKELDLDDDKVSDNMSSNDIDSSGMYYDDIDSEDAFADDTESEDVDSDNLDSEDDYIVDNINTDEDDDLFDNDIFAMLGRDEDESDEYDVESETEDHSLIADEVQDELELSPESELLNLLNHYNPENPLADDVQAISDLIGGISDVNKSEKEYPEDVGQVFHEALEAVSDLSDPDHGILDILQETDFQDKKKSKKKTKKAKKEKKEKKKEKKDSLFARVFSNVEYDEAEIRKMEAKKEAAATKKSKKDKGLDAEKEEEQEDASDIKRQRAEAKAEVRAEKKKARLAKKEDKKKLVEINDEIDTGRINRVGAGVVFVFFGLVVIFLLISTNLFSYSLSIKNATSYFDRKRYTQAYNEVYGIELKDEDIELYDKIMTVMFVNKQLNSYNNYYHMRKYPEALDSLLKGLQRYDKYLELATLLGIKTDLDYVRNQIIAELYNVFSLTEDEAMNILNSESQAKYSIAIYDVVLENITYY